MNTRKGFTLAEIIVVTVIMATIAAVAIAGFTTATNKTAADQAVAYLRSIRAGQKMYHAKYTAYAGDFSGNRTQQASAIQAALAADVKLKGYSFAIDVSPDGQTFTAMARKGSVVPQNCNETNTICINQAGVWSGSSSYKPKNTVNG